MSFYKRYAEYLREQTEDQQEIQMAIKLQNHINNMSKITATSSGSAGNYSPVPEGNHVARCYQMIHIGTIEENYQGETKLQNKIRVVFELPNETKVFKEENGEQPYSIGKDYTLSLHEKSNLRRDLESWRGKKFTEAEAQAFDVSVLLGKPCMLNVVHKTSKQGKVFADIASVAPLPKGLECPDPVNPTLTFGYDPFDPLAFESLPQWLRDKIFSSLEFKHLQQPQHTQVETSDDLPF